MWYGAVTVYGIGLRLPDVVQLLKYLMVCEGSEEASQKTMAFLRSDLGINSLEELSTKSSKAESLLREVGGLFRALLEQLELSIVCVPHDLTNHLESNIAVVGKTVCVVTDDSAPVTSSSDPVAVQKVLSQIFGPERCLPGHGYCTEKTALSFYTLPLDCHCCT